MKALALAALLLLTGALTPCQVNVIINSGVAVLDNSHGATSFKINVNQTVTSAYIVNSFPGPVTAIFTQDATGHAVTWGGGNSNYVSPCSVSTTANATTACVLTFDNSSNSWVSTGGGGGGGSGNGVGFGASPVVGWYLGPNCPAANTGQCFNTYADTVIVQGCSYSNASTTVTCPANTFTSTAVDSGKMIWGADNTSVSGGGGGCNPFLPSVSSSGMFTGAPATIVSVTDSAHAVISSTPNNSSTTHPCVIFGHNDDAGTNALETAYSTATSCPKVTLAAGNYIFKYIHFLTQPAACANLGAVWPNGNQQGNMVLSVGFELEGRGVGPTVIYVPPDFPEASAPAPSSSTCNNGQGSTSCFNVPRAGFWHDLAFTSGPMKYGMPNNTKFINLDVGSIEHVNIYNIGNNSGYTTSCLYVSHWAQLYHVNLSSCGTIGIEADGSSGGVWFRIYVDSNYLNNIKLNPGAAIFCHYCQTGGSGDGNANQADINNVAGFLVFESGSIQNEFGGVAQATGYLGNNATFWVSNTTFLNFNQATNGSDILCIFNPCSTNIRNAGTLSSSGALGATYRDVGGSILNDQGGNNITGTTYFMGSLSGDQSITGTPDIAANHALTSGWGTLPTQAFVSSATATSGGSSVSSQAVTLAVTAGNQAIVYTTTSSVTDVYLVKSSAGETCVTMGQTVTWNSNGNFTTMWMCPSLVGGSETFTASLPGGATSSNFNVTVEQYSGLSLPNHPTATTQKSNTGSSGSAPNVAAITVPANAGLFAIAAQASNLTQTAGTNFTLDSITSGWHAVEYWVNATTGAQTSAFGTNATANWVMITTVIPASRGIGAVNGQTKEVTFTVGPIAGSPTASPVITDTFASPFWITPSGGCTLTQIGGNFGDISNPVASALSTTGVTWTFTGTPVVGHTYTFQRHCGQG